MLRHIVSMLEKTCRSDEHSSETTSLYIENTIINMVIKTWTRNNRHRRSSMKQHDLHSFYFVLLRSSLCEEAGDVIDQYPLILRVLLSLIFYQR
jgi:hypothetical protein